MRRFVFFALSVFILSLASCHVSKPVSMTSGVDTGGTVLVEIWASTDLVQVNEIVKFRATATNKGTKTQTINLSDYPVLDIWIERESATGKTLTRWSDGKALTSEMTQLELRPGESKSIELDYAIRECCNPVGARANFVYSDRALDNPVRPSVIVFVGSYPRGVWP
jgi:hypothetical protein